MTMITQYQVIKGDVTIDFDRFCDNAQICDEANIGSDFEKRGYQLNDSEVALDLIRSFIQTSLVQLQSGHKVILTRDGNLLKDFNDLNSFRTWANEFFSISRYRFIKSRVVDKVISDEN